MSDRPDNPPMRKPLPHRKKAPAGQWQTWRMDELGTAPAAKTEKPAPKAAPEPKGPSAWDLGFAAGEKAGRQAGHKAGFAEGRIQGHAKGLEEGRREAAEEMKTNLAAATAPLAALIANADEALRQLDEDVAEHLVDLALAVGRQLAREALDTEPGEVLNIVRDLLHSDLLLSGKPRLWLHPDDLLLVREHLGEELVATGWLLQPDEVMTRGGCRLSSSSGEVDASWEARWQSIRRQVRQRRQQSEEDSE